MNVDEKSWQLFFDLHWPLFYSVAMGSGLSLEEAQDVVQETILSAVKGVGQLKARQKLGRRWLLGIIRSHTVRMLPHRRGFLPSLDEQLAIPWLRIGSHFGLANGTRRCSRRQSRK